MNNKFFAVYGTATTSTEWERPNLIRLGQWWNDMLLHPDLNNYEFYLVGNFAEKIFGISQLETWDVDVVVLGELDNISGLRRLLNDATQLGFNHKLLMDISWQNELWSIDEWKSPCFKIRPSTVFTKRINHKEMVHIFEYDSSIPIEDDFVLGEYTQPHKAWKKYNQRYLEGHYIGINQDLKELFA